MRLSDKFKRVAASVAFAFAVPTLAHAADPLPEHYKELYFAAAREGRADLIQGMIKDGVPIDMRDSQGYTALIIAAYDGQRPVVDLLLSMHADPCAADTKGNTALMGTAFKNELEIAKLLVTHCDVNARNANGQTAAMMAALVGHTDFIKMLAEHGADLGLKDNAGATATSVAQQQGNAEMVQLIASLSAPKLTPAPNRSN
ncbi:MAG: ankyrin repeat domain-containing protein [Hyphomicrobiales bacterium]|nr:ankyrin repeat domain-containing protein [Hyphomicrobiales bacterium]MBV8663694.1 ankyrin repeat domain-containing protein [Hyphomicrobiales bacterium]